MRSSIRRAISVLLILTMLFSLGGQAFATTAVGAPGAGDTEISFDGGTEAASPHTLTLPAGLKTVEAEAFYGDTSLEEVVIPYGAESIGALAFAYSGVKRIHIPDTVTYIADDAFAGLSAAYEICAPQYSYAYEFAINRNIPWIDSLAVQTEDILTILDDDFWSYEDAELTIDELSFEPFPTEGITDPAELKLVQEFNALQAESAAINAEMIALRDSFVSSAESYNEFLEEGSVSFSEDGFSFGDGSGEYHISTEVTDALGTETEVEGAEMLDSGSLIMKVRRADGEAVYLNTGKSGPTLATEAEIEAYEQLAASGQRPEDEDAIYAASWWDDFQSQIGILRGALDIINKFCGDVNYFIAGMTEKAEAEARLAKAKRDTCYQMHEQYPNGVYSAHRYRYELEYDLRLRTLEGFRSLGKAWAKLNLFAAVSGAIGNIQAFGEVSAILSHRHPTTDERIDPETRELARTVSTEAIGLCGLYAGLIGLDISNIVQGVQTIMSLISVAAGPAGVGISLGIKVATNIFKDWLDKKGRQFIATLAVSYGGNLEYRRVLALDAALHQSIPAGKVKGQIFDKSTGAPLSGVRLTCNYGNAVTDANGCYEMIVPCGSHKLWMEKDGYVKAAIVVTVSKEVTVCYGRLSPSTEPTPTPTPTPMPEETPSPSPIPAPTPTPTPSSTPVPLTTPDSDFWRWAVSNYRWYWFPSQNELDAITYIDCSNMNLTSLTGISYFRNLKYLNCSDNQLTSLNVSGCTALEELDCSDNKLTSLNVSGCTALTDLCCSDNYLTSLDVSNNTALTGLNCGGNQLTGLDVSNNTALTYLDCDQNQLKSLDVSNNTALGYLNCCANQLTSLDVSNNTALGYMDCHYNQLTSLDVSRCTALWYLSCSANMLTSLNVTGCTALTILYCDYNQLTSLNVSDFTVLDTLHCMQNQLTSLNISGCSALTYLLCYNNQAMSLNASGCSMLTNLEFEGNRLTSLNVSGCSALTYLSCPYSQLTSLDVSNCSALTYLSCPNSQFTSLDVSSCSALTYLSCPNSQLTSLDVSSCSALTYLSCPNNQLMSLNVSGCNALTYLACSDNHLTSLDLSDCTALTELSCSDNHLTSLDLTDCTSLTNLSCFRQTAVFEPLKTDETYQLDFAELVGAENLDRVNVVEVKPANTQYSMKNGVLETTTALLGLTYTYAHGGPDNGTMKVTLTNKQDEIIIDETYFPDANFRSYVSEYCDTYRTGSLGVDEIEAMTDMDVSRRNIADLTGIAYFTALTRLNCEGNLLKHLDVSANTALEQLYCAGNQLTSLDVSRNTALKELSCGGNRLTSLDVSHNTALTTLDCSYSQLTSLDLSHNTALTNLYCNYSHLTSLDASHSTALTSLDCRGNNINTLYVSNNSLPGIRIDADDDVTVIGKDAPAPTPEPTPTPAPTPEPTPTPVISDSTFWEWAVTQYDTSGDGELSQNELDAVTGIDCSGLGFTSMEGINLFGNLRYLDCTDNQLASLDVSHNTALTTLILWNNQLTSLDVSHNTALTYLDCDQNQLKSLDISQNTALITLYCSVNQLESLDVSHNTALTRLYCSDNELTSLDVSQNTALELVSCGGNQLTSLDVSNCAEWIHVYVNDNVTVIRRDHGTTSDSGFWVWAVTQYDANGDGELSQGELDAVTLIDCSGLGLTSLDGVNRFGNLTLLDCSYNQLTSLDVSGHTALTELYCHNNQLTSLDVSGCPALKELSCGGNRLTSLDVSGYTALIWLYCDSNQLTSLNVSGCNALTVLWCTGNRLTSLDVSGCAEGIEVYADSNVTVIR